MLKYLKGEMSIHELARAGDVEGVRVLLDAGTKVNVRDGNQNTTLHIAATNEPISRLLLDRGAEVNVRNIFQQTPLHYAATDECEAVVRLLLDHGAAVDVQNILQDTPLHQATRNGHEAVVRLLLDRGAAVDMQNDDQKTPLYIADIIGHKTIARLLLDRGANPFLTDRLSLEDVKQERISKANQIFPIASECILPPEIMLVVWATAIQIPEKRWLSLI